ncbi:hypothetical protein HPP92_006930 [Vanilla planifolia]|uniref:Divinyl chlorophyllide a 8-vinyl-reductase, chloroplastic n=1 Tax=Vanilla planifolia TaxID=51239 RepID=A0A835RBQ4_VANPL|nr:hypothetical protein HPP92_006930 [Vanilla planifolia]
MSISLTSAPNPFLLLHSHIHSSSIPFSPLRRHFYTKPNCLSLTITASSSSSTSPSTTQPNSTPSSTPSSSSSFRSKPTNEINVLVTGCTGYIGKFVVKELCRRGFNVIAVSRDCSGIRGRNSREDTIRELTGATVCFSDVTDASALSGSLDALSLPIDAAVCCLASRTGGIRDSWKIDYEASRNTLAAARRFGAAHFVLLSAICVQKPLLEFQRAKLKFESELGAEAAKDPAFSYSIVRPTAFFKSLGGQVETVREGKPYVMFGDGRLCSCRPISEEDLAAFIADCVVDENKAGKILPVGGPGKSLTPLEQGEMLFRLLDREPRFLKVPIGVMDFAIALLDFLSRVFPVMEDAAEYGRIGRYYATESMLLLDPETGEYSSEKTPSYGTDTLEEFFTRVIREGMAGQELGEQGIL